MIHNLITLGLQIKQTKREKNTPQLLIHKTKFDMVVVLLTSL